MRELPLQSDVVKVVKANSGFARKLSHRFLIGVSDLIVKLPDYQTALLEVKAGSEPLRSKVARLDVTVQQARFLQEAANAGVLCGVMSFLVGRQKIGILIVPVRKGAPFQAIVGLPVLTADHKWYPLRDKRLAIINVLVDFFKENDK